LVSAPGRPHQRYRSAWSVVSCPVQALSAEALSRNNQAFVQLAEARLDKVAVTISAKSDGDPNLIAHAGLVPVLRLAENGHRPPGWTVAATMPSPAPGVVTGACPC
jgi:hypothetical protein